MKFDLAKSLTSWRKNASDRIKLQHVYLAIAIASIIVAGLVGLVNYTAGQRLVSLGLLSLGVYLINMIVWALVDGLVLVKIDRQTASSVRKEPSKASKSMRKPTTSSK